MVSAPPPDFRLVGVEPGPSSRRARHARLAVGTSAFCVGLAVLGRLDWVGVAVALALAAAALAVVNRALGPVLASDRISEARMSIVPWGVLVHSEPEPRVLRWAAVCDVQVDAVHEMDQATPSTRWSVVKIRTCSETLGGRAPGDVALEGLEANVHRYAEEAGRPLALDLDGETVADEVFDPVCERLIEEARWLLASGGLEERLALAPRSYRHPGCVPCPETRRVLARLLAGASTGPADARPLAAVITAEIGERSLLGELMALTASPHPLVAVVARASALKLGADVKRVGALDELAEFVPPADLEQLSRWAGADQSLQRAAS